MPLDGKTAKVNLSSVLHLTLYIRLYIYLYLESFFRQKFPFNRKQSKTKMRRIRTDCTGNQILAKFLQCTMDTTLLLKFDHLSRLQYKNFKFSSVRWLLKS